MMGGTAGLQVICGEQHFLVLHDCAFCGWAACGAHQGEAQGGNSSKALRELEVLHSA